MLVQGIDRVGPGRIGGRGQHIRLTAYPQDIRGMATARAFGVVGMNSAATERSDAVFHKARFVQGVGVNRHLHIVFFRHT